MNPASSQPFTPPNDYSAEPPPAYSQYPERQSAGQATTFVYNKLSEVSHDASFRKEILKRVIEVHNTMVENSADRLELVWQNDFTARYPKLDKWIEKKLAFLDNRELINFAFASSHLEEYYQAEDFCPGKVDKIRIDFFRRYFSLEGKNNGMKKLNLLESTEIIFQRKIASLRAALQDEPYLEPIAASEQPPYCSQFNFPVALKVIGDASSNWKALARTMCEIFPRDEVDKIDSECIGNVTKALLTVLNKIACSGKRTEELVDVLKQIGRTDISERLQKALQSI
ncbi:hypothetical protein J7438_22830 [Thalassotalea sp. G20_0]|uniref:death domain-containing protein n=1 Tax=Thalassotalea sp. G20_0 TaxID=2821093 RepID=UPI001ADD4C34|nr:death domain-containing protein [Thalassotalea sp. G20_0]MBO9496899.1 hypothetical protein [Thalassotalea sp. G20_0]